MKFCEKVQLASPVGAYIVPIPGETSGYGGNVIFADGTFVEGSTLELSADGPLRDPFVAYTQVEVIGEYLSYACRIDFCDSDRRDAPTGHTGKSF